MSMPRTPRTLPLPSMDATRGQAASGGYPDSTEEWLAHLLSPDAGAHDSATFERWRAADPEHASAYAQAEHIHRTAASLGGDPMLRAGSQAGLRETARRRRQWSVALGLAASLMLGLGVLWQLWGGGDSVQRYASGTGLPQTVRLDDGTQLRLDAQTELTVRLEPHLRELTLQRGRVQISVAHDAARPFLARAGSTEIRDVGTVFQISRDEGGVDVGLLSGRVALRGARGWHSELSPAQQLHIDPSGRAGPVNALDTIAAAGWTEGELVFRARRLDQLLAEMNRYTSTQLRLGDPHLADLRISGSFRAGDPARLARALARGWALQVVRTAPDELTLLPADPVRPR